MSLEVACFNVSSAKTALAAGADRIELCSGLASGGVTPEIHDFEELLAYRRGSADFNSVPIYVMIRPRGGDFVYTAQEFDAMKESLTTFRDLGADGFVFGILAVNGMVDEQRNAELVALAEQQPCTFHRAFDQVADMKLALEVVISCEFRHILASGGEKDVMAGRIALERLMQSARGRIDVMPGGGLRSANLATLKQDLPTRWWHSSAILQGDEADEDEIRNLKAVLSRVD